jgi:aminoglycoside phosphotransferase (APT) family kinase protein
MNTAEKIIAVRPAHRFNEAALGEFLRREIADFPKSMAVHQFGYGQSNPTFLLSGGGKEYVLRKKPPGKLLPSAHAVEREYRILKTLNDTFVPVPQVYLLCQDDTIIGTSFYVMERVKGRIFRTPTAPEAADAKERAAIFDAMNDTLANIHQVDWDVLGLADFGKPGNYMQRQVSRWTQQYEASKTEQID